MSRTIVGGHLVVDPVPTPTSIRWRRTWELVLGDGPADAGPAGLAVVRLAGGVTVWCDYADHTRLLQVDVPDGDHRAIVEHLLGTEVVDAMASTTGDPFSVAVDLPAPARAIGRAAVAIASLTDRAQPIGGLWAVEIAHLLGPPSVLAAEQRPLVDSARAAIDLLEADLAPVVEQRCPGLVPLLASASLGGPLGPLGTELARRQADEVAAGVEALFADLDLDPDLLLAEPVPAGRAGFTFRDPDRGDLRSDSPRERVLADVELSIDHTIQHLVEHGAAAIEDDTLVVTLTVRPGASAAPHALGRTDVRVSDADGRLVASSIGMRSASSTLHSRLPVPAGAGPLHVVVGRDLPHQGLLADDVVERRAVHRSRRLVDDLRRRGPDPAGGFDRRRLREEAATAWENVGRDDQVAALADVEPAPPYVTEQAAAVLGTHAVPALEGLASDSGADLDRARAGRDLAWSLGDVEMAARIERGRLARGAEADLSLVSHDRLALALGALDPAGPGALDLDL
jgi:hypothetical protein